MWGHRAHRVGHVRLLLGCYLAIICAGHAIRLLLGYFVGFHLLGFYWGYYWAIIGLLGYSIGLLGLFVLGFYLLGSHCSVVCIVKHSMVLRMVGWLESSDVDWWLAVGADVYSTAPSGQLA